MDNECLTYTLGAFSGIYAEHKQTLCEQISYRMEEFGKTVLYKYYFVDLVNFNTI